MEYIFKKTKNQAACCGVAGNGVEPKVRISKEDF